MSAERASEEYMSSRQYRGKLGHIKVSRMQEQGSGWIRGSERIRGTGWKGNSDSILEGTNLQPKCRARKVVRVKPSRVG